MIFCIGLYIQKGFIMFSLFMKFLPAGIIAGSVVAVVAESYNSKQLNKELDSIKEEFEQNQKELRMAMKKAGII